MAGNYHAIVVLPGTTGTSLVADGKDQTSIYPLWSYQAVKEAAVFGASVAKKLEVPLWAGRPGGYKTINDKDPTGYASLITKLVEAGNNSGQSWSWVCTSWPTDNPSSVMGNYQQPFDWLPSPLTGNTVIGWGYDWRQNNTITATMLQNFLYHLNTAYAPDGGWANITLIGHSMGGLVSRAYLESVGPNATPPDPSLGKIDQLITLGTPHLGAPLALAPISNTLQYSSSGNANANFFAKVWEDDIVGPITDIIAGNVIAMIDAVVNSSPGANQTGMGVSTYQLLPPNLGTTFTNFIAVQGDGNYDGAYSVFATLPQTLQTLLTNEGENTPNLNAAATFFGTLKYTAKPSVPYNCLYGIVDSTHPSADPKLAKMFTTTTGFTYNPTQSPPLATVDTDGGGDLVVPYVSAMFTGNSSDNVKTYKVMGADHITMPANPDIQKKVKELLGFKV